MEAGYKENELDTQRNKALNSSTTSKDPNTTNIQPDTLVLAFSFLKEHNQIRKLFKEIQPDINSIIGDTRILFALRKGPSIGNLLIHNRQVCTSVDEVNAPKVWSQVLDKMGLYVLGGSSWFHGISNLNWGRQKALWGIGLALVVAFGKEDEHFWSGRFD